MNARIAVAAGLVALAFSAQAAPPDVVFYNGNIVTLDAKGTKAQAVAVKDGRFVAIGGTARLRATAGPATKLVDLGGRTVVPGLIDAHTHPMETMMMKETWVDARYPGTASVAQALDHIAAWVAKTPKGDWVYVACVSASENKFAEKRLPTRAELDRVAPDNPVVLANGTHMSVANSAALAKLGVAKGTTRMAHGGGVILDAAGEPTGVLTDAQGDIPYVPTAAQLERYYTTDIQALWNRHGFTSVLAITPASALPVLQKLAAAHVVPSLRYTAAVWTSSAGDDMPADLAKFRMPPGTDPAWYRFGGIKMWMDGENDCRTGYMNEPYVGVQDTDPPGGRGSLVSSQATADRFAGIAAGNGVFGMMHCSGDAAVDMGLTAYEHAATAGKAATIRRIEHFGMFQLDARQLARARALRSGGLRISVQPTWLLDLVKADLENMPADVAKSGFRFRAMIDAGLEPAAGTDVTGIYLDNVNPFLGVYAAVTRQSDAGLFEPAQAVSVDEALRMWTIWAAKSIGEDAVKGSIERGKYADMTVLTDNVYTLPKAKLKDVRPVLTIVGGRVVFDASAAP
jgi:predicted amidohydrolase YtcJ